MKALVKTQQSVRIENVAKPTPRHRDDVVIRVALTGLCRTDVYVAEGIVPAGKDDLILGHEFSGIVEAVGESVTNVRVGDRVCVMPFLSIETTEHGKYAHSTQLGVHHDGSLGEYACVPAYTVYKLPESVSLKMGAYLEPVCASMAVLKAPIHPLQKGLIYGDNRISQLTLRILQAEGFADVTTFDHTDASIAPLQGDHYDFIIETLATTATMAQMIHAVKPGGVIVLKSRQHTPVGMNINDLVKKDITLAAVNYAPFEDCIALAASGRLDVEDLFGDVYPLEQFADIFEMSKGKESKKLFLTAANDDVWRL